MGFGTLFFGYFLLLNVTYFGYTDLISALIMLMALYKLTPINKTFKYSSYAAIGFSVFGTAELILTVISTFIPTFKEETVLLYITPIRYLIIAALSFLILGAVREISCEVGLKQLSSKASLYSKISAAIFVIAAIFDLPLMSFIPRNALAVIAFLILLSIFTVVIINLTIIYKAYMKICMPEDLTESEEKASRFGFVNKFRAHEEEKRKEYRDYRISKMQNKNKKTKRKK